MGETFGDPVFYVGNVEVDVWPVYGVAVGTDELVGVGAVERVDVYGVEDCPARGAVECEGVAVGGRREDFVV